VRVTVCYATDRTRVDVMRTLENDRRRLIISAPWGQRPAETLAAVADRLTTQEAAEVARAFGLAWNG
jgi:hypothetical protein